MTVVPSLRGFVTEFMPSSLTRTVPHPLLEYSDRAVAIAARDAELDLDRDAGIDGALHALCQ